ncbi:unnamed protein product [Blepharisma stoltei]|uniref:UBC core domain-containing protein n=1 Tax=Blepharisma stoltei TaxID=1481888 RepID=A0AAU9JZ60_9CILI|nr:unnamed protein product [Blepharisma stoltei]
MISGMMKRISKEINDEKKFSKEEISFWQNDENNYAHLIGAISGVKNSPYEDGIFYLEILISEMYPFKPPNIKFITKIYHPWVNVNGWICLDMLRDQWSPAYTIRKALVEIQNLMTSSDIRDPLNTEIFHLYKTDRPKYESTTREWTKAYAM